MADPGILLLHGFSSSSEASWSRNGWLDILADTDRTVIAPDLMGHGDAEKPHDPAAYADMEERIHDLISDVGAVDVIGFSMGARMALCIEAMHPGTFGRIVAGGVGANLFAAERNPSGMADALEGRGETLDPLGRAFVTVAHQPPNDPLALAACIRRPLPPLGPAEMAAIRCPVLVVVGDRDTVAMPPDQLIAALPDAKLATVKGADHLGTMKGFGFLEAALGFLDALPD
jgi:pimeloyl-ACP methyl ester carboxylesterase